MYALHGSNWVRVKDDGSVTRVSAQEVSDYLVRHRHHPERDWSWRVFALGLLTGVLIFATIVGWIWNVIGWALGVVLGSLKIVAGIAILALLVWGAVWLFRKIASGTHLDWDDVKARVASSWKHRGGET